ncbi:hypothetical protein NUW54_g8966 [Trametes sanguinea]|uniref:Uncharacterized protein n=1 Tax=Trametes sanguinea TaxID=158606 RepID=A0ACC1P9J4_9APHY|nr:hypothetical protein NUW54_g8966 [Trametes sanguinea]
MLVPLSLLAALPIRLSMGCAHGASLKPSISAALAASASATGVSGAASGSSSSSSGNGSVGDEVVASTCTPKSTYAFAVTTPDVNTVSLEASDEELLPRFVNAAHQNNVKAMLTVGGWTGSQYFSSAVATEANRTAFVKTVLGLVSNQNFLSFLQALRADPAGQNLTLSAAAGITPFAGPDGNPMSDVSDFAKVLDYVAIMNYDVWGSWSSSVGPNAPLNDTCASAADQQGSAVSAVKAWTAAGFPANQLVLGVASYGHSFSVTNDAALSGNTLLPYPAFNKANQPLGDKWDTDAAPSVDQCGNPTGGPSGIFDFFGLIDSKFLTANGTSPASTPAKEKRMRFPSLSSRSLHARSRSSAESALNPHPQPQPGRVWRRQEGRGARERERERGEQEGRRERERERNGAREAADEHVRQAEGHLPP